jgi:3-oxoadipate enol-lactonase
VAELHYTVDGVTGGPVVVLGSSLGTTGALWEPQMPALESRLRVVRYDHRGHGGSPAPPGPYTIEELGGDVLDLLDRLGLERVWLGGLSLGGMVAMWVAAAAPHRVQRLALLCTSAHLGPPEAWQERIAAVRAGGMSAIADSILDRWYTPAFRATSPDVVSSTRAMLVDTPADGYVGCCAAIQHMDLRPVLDRITAHTLVIAGGDDPATPPEHAALIAAGIPGARLEIVPGAAHLANAERPTEINSLLADFFEVGG